MFHIGDVVSYEDTIAVVTSESQNEKIKIATAKGETLYVKHTGLTPLVDYKVILHQFKEAILSAHR